MTWDIFFQLLGYLLAPITGIATWFAGKRSRNNSTLNELQETIDMLVKKNSDLIEEITKLREENSSLKSGQAAMKHELSELKKLVVKVES